MTIRIIGGELKGRKLATVRGLKTRPTTDRVRESIFNILGNRIRGARVLDLYAGTGAMGIEALSRGAESVLFADDHKGALAALEKNINTCSLQDRSSTIKWNVFNNLNILRSHSPAFNLVFLDPPYDQHMIQPTLSNLVTSQCLESGSRLVVEHAQREPIPEKLPEFKISDQRRYGKTLVSFLIYMV